MKDNLFKNITKNNLNNNLEAVLSSKEFSEETKNVLLNIFYKIENGYNDYKTVKRNTYEKKEYIKKLIKIIEKDCDKIEFLKQKDKTQEVVNSENKEIICYPVETKILYSIAKIQKKNIVVKYIDKNFEEAFSFILNTGNNINMVEPLRDFNGFSWNTVPKEIEDISCNLIYQNIIFLLGNKFVDKWVNNYNSLIDYFDIFQAEVEKQYGKSMKEHIINEIIELSIMINSKYNSDFKYNIINQKQQIEDLYYEMQDKEKYISKVSKSKKQKEKEIKKIDKILNNKELIAQEYEKRNEKLPLEKKIFSIRVLKKNLKEEREKLLKEIENLNNSIKPKEFIKQREIIIQKYEIVGSLTENIENNIYNTLIDLQKNIIKCINKKIKEVSNKQDLIELIYQFRYYCYLPITLKTNISEDKKLQRYIEKVGKELIQKAIADKLIPQITEDENLNYKITKKVLLSKIISLEDINIKLMKNKENALLTVFDEDVEDFEINVKNEGLKIKVNKKVKFINL